MCVFGFGVVFVDEVVVWFGLFFDFEYIIEEISLIILIESERLVFLYIVKF